MVASDHRIAVKRFLYEKRGRDEATIAAKRSGFVFLLKKGWYRVMLRNEVKRITSVPSFLIPTSFPCHQAFLPAFPRALQFFRHLFLPEYH